MKIGLGLLTQIQALPGGGWITQTINDLVASILGGYHIEHNDDDTHKAIHADTISERARTTPLGEWITPVFQPSDFGTLNNITTWTVTSATLGRFAYTLVGKTMTVAIYVASSSVGAGTAQFLTIKIPGGYKSTSLTFNPLTVFSNNGARAVGYLGVNPTSSTDQGFVYLEAGGVNWAASAGNTSLWGELSFEVQ